ncbi:SIR2 family protein [Halalkalibaculum sp. DA384]|uniref:SIR2 family protein n=1 Tax=Halalkalibaculum sp. DA384 TaxID=3373606 RepID=UPI0037543FD0
MKFYSTETDGWKNLEDEEDNKQRIQALLVELLKSKNLNVLSGLGTSLTINEENNLDNGTEYIAPKMSDLWTTIEEQVDNFEDIKSRVEPGDNDEENGDNDEDEYKFEDIEELLSRCQQYYNLEENQDIKDFIDEAETIILDECDFITDEIELKSHSQFLRKIAQRPSKLDRTKVFTTNYDECFEKAANENRFHVIDGFSYLHPRTFDATYFDYDLIERKDGKKVLIPSVFHLYKLHGSIGWKKEEGKIIQSKKSNEELDPCLIYPQSTKYELSYQQPYLEMMNRFQISLRQPNTAFIVVGFGFNDDHLAQPIINALRSNVKLKLLIVDPSLEAKMQDDDNINDYLVKLKKLVDNGDSRISFLEAKFDELVQLIPDIAHKSEKDRMIEGLQEILSQNS